MDTYSTPVKAEGAAAAALPVKKVEFSPNSLAKCKSCRNKIQERSERIGIRVYYTEYKTYRYLHYHLECCPDDIRSTVPNIHQTLIRLKQTENEKYQIVQGAHGIRHELLQQLKRLRLVFAKHIIHSDVALDEIVFILPETNNQLLSISGIFRIGPSTVLQNFGIPMLSIIRKYKNKQRIIDYDTDEDNNSVAIGETLTCEQLVQQKFDHAAANGYIIEIYLISRTASLCANAGSGKDCGYTGNSNPSMGMESTTSLDKSKGSYTETAIGYGTTLIMAAMIGFLV